MLVTSADLWEVEPGEVMSWTAVPDVTAAPEPVGLSVNQRNHLAGADAGARTVWLAACFEVDGPIDAGALAAAFRSLLARHSALQCEFRSATSAVRHDPARLAVRQRPVPAGDTTTRLRTLLDRECAPFAYPAFALAAVSRPDRSTVVCGFDHAHVDAHSIALVARDLGALYRGAELPVTSSFLTRVVEWSEAPAVADPAMASWWGFLDAIDYRLPVFPLDIGLPEGETAVQATDRRLLADAETAADLGEAAERAGTTTYGALLSTMASALDSGALPVLVPVQTRRPEDADAVGWFTTTVPAWADPDLTRMGEHLRGARERAGLPLDQVLAALPRPLHAARRDVFMVSYVDYRRLPGEGSAQHVSGTSPADDVQLWLSRTDEGIHLRTRFPDVAAAHRAVGRFLTSWPESIRNALRQ